jgi:hypothetical protein
MFKVFLSLLASVLLATGCASDVATDYNSGVNFSAFNTYQYQENEAAPLSLDGARIKQAVDNELGIRGFTMKEQGADLVVRYDILEGTELRADGPSFGFGFGTGSYNSGYGVGVRTPTRVKEKKFGKLAVELVDSTTNDVVWRSVSQRQLTETMKPADRDVFVQEQVHKMFEEYPIK